MPDSGHITKESNNSINYDMKNTVRISIILLMLLIAGSLTLSAQRGMRGMRPDSSEMKMKRMNQWQMPMGHMGMGYGMGFRMGPGRMGPGRMGPGMWGGPMRPGMGHPGMGMRQEAPGRNIENIPNLTEKQKNDITELRQKNQQEMQKIRDEMQLKMKEMRESQRTKIMNLLTPEQKKWFEENAPKPLSR
jgi:hypothetical protein